MPPYTLKYLAEAGYILGLATIGEVANHMHCHYDAYFLIEELEQQTREFEAMIEGHDEDSIFKYLTDEDKKRMDDELEKVFEGSVYIPPESFEEFK